MSSFFGLWDDAGCGHARLGGHGLLRHWIPACAGMTKRGSAETAIRQAPRLRLLDSGFRRNDGRGCDRVLQGTAKGLSGWQQTHFSPRRHSSEGWNPVVLITHSRKAGMTTRQTKCGPAEIAIRPAPRLRPPRRLVPDAALPPRPGGHPSRGGELEPPRRRERAWWKCDFHGSVFGELSRTAELAERPCFKISGLRAARLLLWGGVSLCRLPAAGRRGNSDSIRVILDQDYSRLFPRAAAPPRLSMPAGAGLNTGAVQR